MKQVFVLGDGQLARMLQQAGEPLGISVFPIRLDSKPELIQFQESVITAEIEHWPETTLTRKLTQHSGFINLDTFSQLTDRLKQKKLLDKLSLATAPWAPLASPAQWPEIFVSFRDMAIIKHRVGSYDGRGQWRIQPGEQDILPKNCYGRCIVEQRISFDGEVSLIGARSTDGTQVFYPLTYNFHQEGILHASVVFPSLNSLQKQAENMLSAILNELKYDGVMAMECFIVGDRLVINELAPRVHNSGHWTQNGATISQFELHLRAILPLPLPIPVIFAPSVMINIIGNEVNTEWLADPLVHLHWYKKEVYAGRKVGHLNLTHPDKGKLNRSLEQLGRLLPTKYQNCIEWARQKLTG
ncbi:MAG: 5-(carboxyamino)imidazole ribonucleotide synthase [Sodalis sp. (in: enterobacteria)]